MDYSKYKQYPTEPGWYCIGWDREDKADQEAFGPDFGPIWYFNGSEWTDEDGELREYVIDPILDCRCEVASADYFAKQG